MEEFLLPESHAKVFLYRYDESFSATDSDLNNLPVPSEIRDPERIMQYKISRFMGLRLLAKGLFFSASGKPFSPGIGGVSITHTIGLVGLMVCDDLECGLDIEVVSQRAVRIASKFCSISEKPLLIPLFEEAQAYTLLWSFKEACFKLHGAGGLTYLTDICLTEVDIAREKLRGYYKFAGSGLFRVSGFFRFFEGKVLVYVLPERS